MSKLDDLFDKHAHNERSDMDDRINFKEDTKKLMLELVEDSKKTYNEWSEIDEDLLKKKINEL